MPALLIYLLKVNVALLLFCLGYYTVLRRLTFYTLNRVYLILAIVFCSLYPAINFTGVVQNHRQLARPLQIIIIDLGNRAQSISPVIQTDYWQWVITLFWLGVGLMTIRLIIQLFSLFNLHHRSKPGVVNRQQVRLMDHDSNPFSFWQQIYINPQLHSEPELESIIAHEQVHVKQWHTLDVLLAELSLIFYWFNPGVWMMKKAISENLEFITDRNILQQGADAKSYQYTLLYTCVNTSSNAIVNHFNISTIKKRIMMMNSKKSAAYNISRYTFVIPAVLVLLLAFGTSKAALVSQGIKVVTKATHNVIGNITASVKPDTTAFKATQTANNEARLTATQTNGTVSMSIDTNNRNPIKNVLLTLKKVGMTDSSYYEINGKQATPAQVSALNPGNVATINIMDSKTAYPQMKPFGSNGVVFITTKDGQDLASTKHMRHKINMIIGDSVKSHIKSDTLVHISATGKATYSVSDAPIYKVPTDGKKTYHVTGTVTYSAQDQPITVDMRGSIEDKPLILKEDNRLILKEDKPLILKEDKPLILKEDKPFLINEDYIKEVQPLIIWDKKEISYDQYKALIPTLNSDKSAQILVEKNSSATKRYGEKAKNGVIIITTKDAKKQ